MKSFLIKIQSFNDIVTNSSMEVYVKSTERTLEHIKEIINSFFEYSGLKVTADDVFEIKLDTPGYWEHVEFEEALDEKCKELGISDDAYCKLRDEERLELYKATDVNFDPDEYYDLVYDQNYVVSVKPEFNNENTQRIAKALCNLQNIFHLTAVNNY